MKQSEIKNLVARLTLEEKAGLCSGQDQWCTKAVEQLGIPAVRTSDGPYGLRTQKSDASGLPSTTALPAVCFPPACTAAAGFDRQLVREMGAELGRECQALGVNVLLGPGVNIKRSPLCGRNFEYFSEDPLLAGELGAAFVDGVQSEGAGTSLKHFFANSQEHRRMDSSSEMDERTMREIYLPAFETVVKKAHPWTIMASYNKIGGVYSTANKKYLTGLLRGEWGFDGLVMSDWGATHDRVAAVEAGCALTMPTETETDQQLVDAVRDGTLKENALDTACEQLLTLAFKAAEQHREGVAFDYEGGHALAKKIAEQSAVLLKNEGELLPLGKTCKAAFIGGFAKAPRFQGGGSSHINCPHVCSALDAAQALGYAVTYAPGYAADGAGPDEELIAEAVRTAAAAEVAVVFAGLPDQMETEGVDRRHLRLPESHNRLIEAVCGANPNTVVVLHNGAPVEMPWVAQPKAILEAYLGGEAVGEATVALLYGDANPCGHLAESFPKKLADNPSYLFYFGEGDTVPYSERFFVGYRYYASKALAPLFPFGHGLSYTTFAYSNLTADKPAMEDTDTLTATLAVKNTGKRAGAALVQLYIAPPREAVIRPVRELKGFEKVWLEPGESKTVTFRLSKRAFAYWDAAQGDWNVENGSYAVQICENADAVLLEQPVVMHSTKAVIKACYTLDTIIGDFAKTEKGHRALDENIGYMLRGMITAGIIPKELGALVDAMGDTLNLAAVESMASRAGLGSDGLSVLFSQQLSLLTNFMPPERKQALLAILDEMNAE